MPVMEHDVAEARDKGRVPKALKRGPLAQKCFQKGRPGRGILPRSARAWDMLFFCQGREKTPVFCSSLPWKAAKGQQDTRGSAAVLQSQGPNWGWENCGASHKSRQELLPRKSQSLHAAWAKQRCPFPKPSSPAQRGVTLGTVCGHQLQAQICTVSLLTHLCFCSLQVTSWEILPRSS